MSDAVSDAVPFLRVVRGAPDDVELAALTAVLAAAAAAEVPGQVASRPSAWRDKAALMRPMPAPGPGAWRASGLAR